MSYLNSTLEAQNTTSTWPLHDLRSSFYMLLPEETYHKTVEEVPPYLFIILYPWGVLQIILEIVALQLLGRKSEWRLHSAVVSYSSTAMFEGFHVFVLRDLELQLYQWIYNNLRLFTLPWNSLTTFFVTLVTIEFGTYWWHRFSHELAIMWASHELHHSSDDFNLSIAFRNSATIRLFKWIFYVPLAFFGVPASVMLTHLVLGSIFNSVIHHNTVPKFKNIIPVLGKVIDFVFVTPSHHRVHHASNKYCIDKNYGQYTILWDRLFGTFQEEKDDEELVYGSLTQPKSYDMATLQFSSYVNLFKKFQSMTSLGDKFKALFYGPGWFPGTPRLGNHDDIPDVSGREKYNPKYPFLVSCYLVINSACIFYSYANMMLRVETQSNFVLLLNLLYIYLAYAAIGGLYDNRSYASRLELSRIVVFLLLSNAYQMLSPSAISSFVYYVLYLDIVAWPFIHSYNKSYLLLKECDRNSCKEE